MQMNTLISFQVGLGYRIPGLRKQSELRGIGGRLLLYNASHTRTAPGF